MRSLTDQQIFDLANTTDAHTKTAAINKEAIWTSFARPVATKLVRPAISGLKTWWKNRGRGRKAWDVANAGVNASFGASALKAIFPGASKNTQKITTHGSNLRRETMVNAIRNSRNYGRS